jgi:hypothetical protein
MLKISRKFLHFLRMLVEQGQSVLLPINNPIYFEQVPLGRFYSSRPRPVLGIVSE